MFSKVFTQTARPMYNSISLILSPFHAGCHNVGPGRGPNYILSRGLQSELTSSCNLPVTVSEVEPVDDKDGEIAQTFEIFRRVAALVSSAKQNGAFPVVLTGNCSVSVGVAAGLLRAADGGGGSAAADLGCVWFDAHDDIHTPDTITSGYGDSMALSLLTGACYKRMLQSVPSYQPLDLRRFVHVGLRDVDEQERELVRAAGLDVIWGGDDKPADFGEALSARLQEKKLASTMVHVDLDSLDASVGHANKFATTGGLLVDDLTRCLSEVAAHTKPESLTLASFDPSFEGADGIADAAIKAAKSFLGAVLSQK